LVWIDGGIQAKVDWLENYISDCLGGNVTISSTTFDSTNSEVKDLPMQDCYLLLSMLAADRPSVSEELASQFANRTDGGNAAWVFMYKGHTESKPEKFRESFGGGFNTQTQNPHKVAFLFYLDYVTKALIQDANQNKANFRLLSQALSLLN